VSRAAVANPCYAVVTSDKRNTEEEVDMTAQVALQVIGVFATGATVCWWMVRVVYRYLCDRHERNETLELGARLRSACS